MSLKERVRLVALALPALAAYAGAGTASVEAQPSRPAGRIEEQRIASRVLGRERRVWVYTPPGYAGTKSDHDLLIVFDGEEYLSDIPLPTILDTLLAERKAPAFVAVLIDDESGAARLDDLGNRSKFADFLAGELIDWVRARWRVTRDPSRTIVAGSSAGGLAAAYAAFRHPEVFGNVISQSGAFWRGNEASNEPPWEWLTSQYASAPKKNVRFYLDVGTTESRGALGGAAPSILEANRRLRDVLRKKGYELSYAEVPEGAHSPEFWRLTLPAAIATLASKPAR
jgi:enterochelin esterase family protein